MGSVGATKTLLCVLNVLFTVLALGLATASIWFFVEVQQFTSLRNSNHYMLDYTVYWPQAVPWMFFVVSVFALCVASCGFVGARKKSKGFLVIYVACLVFTILLLLAAAGITLGLADSNLTDRFVKDTVWDVYFQAKTDNEVADAYGNIEKRLHCCGADSPRDYKNWKAEFPKSCCDVYYHGFYDSYVIDCDFTNKLANERYGCSTVAAQYARIVIKVLSAVAVFIAFLGIIKIVIAVALSKALKRKSRVLAAQTESESKSTLLLK